MPRPGLEAAAALALALLALAAVVLVSQRGSETFRRRVDTVAALTGGDAARGGAAFAAAGCGACHRADGIPGARGRVGPDLDGLGGRAFIAGVLPNTPANLARWIQAPRALAPGTAMPDLGLDAATARDIAAFLYLRGGN